MLAMGRSCERTKIRPVHMYKKRSVIIVVFRVVTGGEHE